MVENEKKLNTEGAWWRPVMVFYAKTTSWVIFPLVLALILAKVGDFSQTSFFIALMIGFGITCSGIYKQIKEYKKSLDKKN